MGITISRGSVGQGTPANIAVELTVASVDSGVITAVTVSTAGAFTAISDITAVQQTSKTGSGVGTPTFDLTLSIASIAVSTPGSGYTTAPTVTLGGAGLVGQSATATLDSGAINAITVSSLTTGVITSVTVLTAGAFTAISDITAVAQTSKNGHGVGTPTFDLTLSIASIAVSTAGTGYTSAPTVPLGGAGLAGQIATAVVMSDSNYGDSACTASLAAGSSCQPVCDAGYNANNALVCVANSALDTVTVAAPPATGATEFPTATLSGGGGQGGELAVTAQVFSASVVHGGDSGYAINDVITISRGSVGQGTPANIAVELTVASVDSGVITAVTVSTAGLFTAISDITAVAQTSKTGSGVGTPTFDLTLSIASVAVSTPGSGYTTAPTVTLGGAGLAGQIATATTDGDAITGIAVSSPSTGAITSVTVTTAGAFTAIVDI